MALACDTGLPMTACVIIDADDCEIEQPWPPIFTSLTTASSPSPSTRRYSVISSPHNGLCPRVSMAGGDSIRCAGYATFGTQALSDHVVAALSDRSACLIANHGMIATGRDLPAAFALAVECEALARMYWQALQIGEPVILDAAEMARVLERFADYRP